MIKRLIFIISNEPWSDLKLSKHYYAIELAKNKSNKVCFINPVKNYKINLSAKLDFHNLENEGITVINYDHPFPYKSRWLTKLNDNIIYNKLDKLFDFKKYENVIFWQFDSFRFIKTLKNRNVKRIYHVADSLITTNFDSEIASIADMVICTNDLFINRYKKINANTIHIPHGINSTFLEKNKGKIKELQKSINPFFILIGSLNMHIDFKLLDEISETYHDKTLLIIGPNKTDVNIDFLINKPNIKYIERIDLPDLNNYVAASKIGLIPYVRDNNNGRNPLKTINYIAQNISVFSSIPTGIPNLENKSIFNFNDFKEFQNLVNNFNQDEPVALLNNMYLDSIQYDKLIDTVLKNLL